MTFIYYKSIINYLNVKQIKDVIIIAPIFLSSLALPASTIKVIIF